MLLADNLTPVGCYDLTDFLVHRVRPDVIGAGTFQAFIQFVTWVQTESRDNNRIKEIKRQFSDNKKINTEILPD